MFPYDTNISELCLNINFIRFLFWLIKKNICIANMNMYIYKEEIREGEGCLNFDIKSSELPIKGIFNNVQTI